MFRAVGVDARNWQAYRVRRRPGAPLKGFGADEGQFDFAPEPRDPSPVVRTPPKLRAVVLPDRTTPAYPVYQDSGSGDAGYGMSTPMMIGLGVAALGAVGVVVWLVARK